MPVCRKFTPLVFLALTICWLLGCDKGRGVTAKPNSPAADNLFTNLSAQSGLEFVHRAGGAKDYFFPAVMSPGVAFVDFDRDGDLDVVFVDSGDPPQTAPRATSGTPSATSDASSSCRLFRQEPQSQFVDVTRDSGLVHHEYGSGVAVGDVNNDGFPDLYFTNYGPDRLFINNRDGKFLDVTAAAGIDNPLWATSAAFLDYDRDGWLDLFVVNYVDYDPAQPCRINSGQRDFCNPAMFRGTSAKLYHNVTGQKQALWPVSDRDHALGPVSDRAATSDHALGPVSDRAATSDHALGPVSDRAATSDHALGPVSDRAATSDRDVSGSAGDLRSDPGRGQRPAPSALFEDASLSSGVTLKSAAGLGVVCADFTGDGWPDVFVANDGHPNFLWINQRDGTFHEEGVLAGVAYDNLGHAQGSMGIAIGDVNLDQKLDLFITNLDGEYNALYLGNDDGTFRDGSAAAGLVAPSFPFTGFGTALVDLEHDGDLDLVAANGRVRRLVAPIGSVDRPAATKPAASNASAESFWLPYVEPNQIMLNDGSGRFEVALAGKDDGFLSGAAVSRGLATGDVDNDGDIDMLVTVTDGPAQLLRNDAPKKGHWLQLQLVDPRYGGRDAYGARVTISAGSQSWTAVVCPNASYLCSHDPKLHFGLGAATAVDTIEVLWPDGVREVFAGSNVDQLRRLEYGTGKPP